MNVKSRTYSVPVYMHLHKHHCFTSALLILE